MANLQKLRSLIPMEEIEQKAQQQIYEALELPFLTTLAIMPDVHMGYSLPIGGVALLNEVISPAYVGYDIGCGMCSIITDMDASDIVGKEDEIFDRIYEQVPVGFNSHEKTTTRLDFESASRDKDLTNKVNAKLDYQIGTLGSGNHFIEIGVNTKDKVSITIHSGSRNIGHSIASHYMRIKEDGLPKGFFNINSQNGVDYVKDMSFALGYALANRKAMMSVVLKILGLNDHFYMSDRMINENHNHAVLTPLGVLHRKGATPAHEGQLGVIPGSMKSGVYITRGLGNNLYLNSASHGAGRQLSRKKAKQELSLEDFENIMSGIKAKVDKSTLDEAPDAYKDLDKVINYQEGIVIDIVDHLRPLVNVKG